MIQITNHYSCGNGMCPGLLLTDRNTVLIQGGILPQGDKAQRTVPGHEDVVEIPREVFETLLGQYRRG